VDPPKRERKNRINYNESDYFKANLKVGHANRQAGCSCVWFWLCAIDRSGLIQNQLEGGSCLQAGRLWRCV